MLISRLGGVLLSRFEGSGGVVSRLGVLISRFILDGVVDAGHVLLHVVQGLVLFRPGKLVSRYILFWPGVFEECHHMVF
jgi:hypothetical protein